MIDNYQNLCKQAEYSQIHAWRKEFNDNSTQIRVDSFLQNLKEILAYPNLDVNAQDDDGDSALSFAIENHLFAAISLLLDHPNINVKISKVNNTTGMSESLLELANNQLKNIKAWTDDYKAMQSAIKLIKEKSA